jgi:putative ABC transport system ATP-binding protein
VNDPQVIVADEPTAHLDSKLSAGFMDLVAALRGEGRTVVIASHDPIVHDSAVVDRVVTMRDGRIVGEGP